MCWFSYRSLKNLFPQKFPCPDFYRKANLCPNIILLCKSFLIICKIQFCKNYFFNKITKFYYLALLLLFSKALTTLDCATNVMYRIVNWLSSLLHLICEYKEICSFHLFLHWLRTVIMTYLPLNVSKDKRCKL